MRVIRDVMKTHLLPILASIVFVSSAAAIPEGPAPNTPEWTARETTNYARTTEAPSEQLANPTFETVWQNQATANQNEWLARSLADSVVARSALGQLAGDAARRDLGLGRGRRSDALPGRGRAERPELLRHRGRGRAGRVLRRRLRAHLGAGVGAARLAGRRRASPGVVIENGSIQATEPLYWWFAQALVRAGYVVLTFDPRGQGRSDMQTPTGEQGSNINSEVFFSGMVNVIDFFRSTEATPYPHNVTCAGTYATVVAAFNPFAERVDPDRLGIAGHSLGAAGVSAVQGYPGSRFAFPDGGGGNPVDAVVAWDSLGLSDDGPPRVPAMGQIERVRHRRRPFTTPPRSRERQDRVRRLQAPPACRSSISPSKAARTSSGA